MSTLKPEPVTLEGRLVRLEPLTLAHVDALLPFGLDPRIWKWMTFPVTDRAGLEAYVQAALDEQARGVALPFATVELAGGSAGAPAEDRVIGTSRFGNIDAPNLGTEIGWTWLDPARWRSGANTEAKILMLGHAFETWGCRRVEFKTDSLNERSRAAIERLGAKFEGLRRNHMVTSSPRMRHSAYYSITDEEWPAVRVRLERFLAAAGGA